MKTPRELDAIEEKIEDLETEASSIRRQIGNMEFFINQRVESRRVAK